ncbi:hypothetical protein [Streptomyces sp. SAJ15]|uniref:hypothetical protein n=1 Tax=Streptomyces sp. SAJ15 TaxID=2011095 RepID=UPI001184D7B8|nr:hypothetical protein [Streptomyces sp. SAJ15]TVL93680.1 hypothetical protein CD790_01045 [Streptomyces sp. SAJ15]
MSRESGPHISEPTEAIPEPTEAAADGVADSASGDDGVDGISAATASGDDGVDGISAAPVAPAVGASPAVGDAPTVGDDHAVDDAPTAPAAPAVGDARTAALRGLARRYLALRRVLWLWLLTGLVLLGWTLAIPGFRFVTADELFDRVAGGLFLFLALVIVVPSALAVAFGVHQDIELREELHDRAAVEHTPRTVPLWHAPGRALLWLLPSLVLGCAGVVLGGSTALSDADGPGHPAVLGMAGTLAAAGALGMFKAVDYYRLVRRELGPADGAEDGEDAGRLERRPFRAR